MDLLSKNQDDPTVQSPGIVKTARLRVAPKMLPIFFFFRVEKSSTGAVSVARYHVEYCGKPLIRVAYIAFNI